VSGIRLLYCLTNSSSPTCVGIQGLLSIMYHSLFINDYSLSIIHRSLSIIRFLFSIAYYLSNIVSFFWYKQSCLLFGVRGVGCRCSGSACCIVSRIRHPPPRFGSKVYSIIYDLSVIYYSSCTIHCSLFTIYHLLLVIHYL
jgi:hypothetical protein